MGGVAEEGIAEDFGKVAHTQLYLKWRAKENLPNGTGNSARCLWQPGREGLQGDGSLCVAESLRCPPHAVAALSIGYTPARSVSGVN